MKAEATNRPVILGEYIVADPRICHGQPTFKGTRIMAWQVLEQIERGMPWADIVREWSGRISEAAIAQTVSLSHLIEKDKPFRGFDAGSRRKYSRPPAELAA